MRIEDLVREHRDAILRAAAARRARNVRLFGSVARREATADSDVDLLVDLEPGAGLFEVGGLLMDLQELLGHRVDVITVDGLRPRIRERVLAEAVPL
ncbi:MAG: nucleotidyltransferase family protein [Actinobacteria bacterium]|nr:nucleotidyltransferase family protein [Actinomycetota bacterium]